MSKGSRIVPVRVPDELLVRLSAAVERSARTRFDGPWSVSEFVRSAIEDKLQHMERSRRSRKR